MLSIENRYTRNKKDVGLYINGVAGWIPEQVALFFYRVAKRLGPGNYVELGCYRGASAVCMAQGIKDYNIDAHVITVDAFDGEALHPQYAGTYSIDTVRQTFEDLELDHIITPVQGLTASMAASYKDTEFNFLFIDADHSYEACKADFEAWSPLVKSGGEVAFHDTNQPPVGRVLMPIDWSRRDIINLGVFTKP